MNEPNQWALPSREVQEELTFVLGHLQSLLRIPFSPMTQVSIVQNLALNMLHLLLNDLMVIQGEHVPYSKQAHILINTWEAMLRSMDKLMIVAYEQILPALHQLQDQGEDEEAPVL